MTPEQALTVLIKATATIVTDRKGHYAIEDALKVLQEFVKPKTESEPEAPEENKQNDSVQS